MSEDEGGTEHAVGDQHGDGDDEQSSGGIKQLVINSPYEEPSQHWGYDRETSSFALEEGRRPAGYLMGDPSAEEGGQGDFVPLELVNRIRPRVAEWRANGHPGVTGVTKRLLEHWSGREGFTNKQLFFCQLEAIETLIWLTEAPSAERVGISVPSDGSDFTRLCSKMATGAGKTVVMAMLVAWQILNKVAYRNDTRFSRHVLVVAPGLTVRSRLEVLRPQADDNYYKEFNIVPTASREKLRQGKVEVRNWHAMQWDSAERIAKRRGVDKRGPKSDEAYVREVMGDMASARNLLVINDEAHHAWRVPPERSSADFRKDELDEATKWVEGLDRIHRTRGILRCHDFTATPFIPGGKSKRQGEQEQLFNWVVSDFGLNDAIESGLVKTPRVVVRDEAMPDAKTYKSRMYHIYGDNSVKGDLNRRAKPEEPLPDLVRSAYRLLGSDWQKTKEVWEQRNHPVPPVMITVANRTETAARIKHTFTEGALSRLSGLPAQERTLHIDSKALAKAENSETPIAEVDEEAVGEENAKEGGTAGSERKRGKLTKNQSAELLRRQVDTVGQEGQPGEHIQHVISVSMLSEGWDAKTVTHIMGLRAFTSQLLCEQVVGRGLRRTNYEVNPDTGLFDQDFVNVFGVPFSFLPHEEQGYGPPAPPSPKQKIEPESEKKSFEISFPNVERIQRDIRPFLTLDWDSVGKLQIDVSKQPTKAILAPSIDGVEDESMPHEISAPEVRMQRVLFEAAENLYYELSERDDTNSTGKLIGNRAVICYQLFERLREFVDSDKLVFVGAERKPRNFLISNNERKIIGHIADSIRMANLERLAPIFNTEQPILSTGDMERWYTGKPNGLATKCHINRCVYDSALEQSVAQGLDDSDLVESWVKNDHLGFEVKYLHGGVPRRYIPDFLVRLDRDRTLVLEVKGDPMEIDYSKEKYLKEWIEAVNSHGGFGRWSCDMYKPGDDLNRILAAHTER